MLHTGLRLLRPLLTAAVVAACSEATSPRLSTRSGTWASLTAGGDQTCGLTTSGVAYCWGDNSSGQLGDGTTTNRPTPVPVVGALTFASLVQGGAQTCGVTPAGAAYCWGDNYYGQLGIGSVDLGHPMPTAVAGGLKFRSLVAGGYHTCGVTISGAAYCWGSNYWGALGDGTLTDRAAPVAVAGGLTFRSLTVGGGQTCGVTTSGAAYCWGENDWGEGGDGSGAAYHTTPVAVAGGLSFRSVTAGSNYTCGLTTVGVAYCWGMNTDGRLGDGSADSTTWTMPTPRPVVGGLTFDSLDAGSVHNCGVTSSGAAYCWGADGAGALGDSAMNTFRTAPVAVRGGLTFASVTAGSGHTCGVTTSGAAYCWGSDGSGELGDGLPKEIIALTPVAVVGGLTFASVTAGDIHTCGVTTGGAAYCWGDDGYGELGDGSTLNRAWPVAVAGGLTFTSLAAGEDYTCGLVGSGAAYCWGRNFLGQLADGSTTDNATPVAVAGGLTFVSVTSHNWHACGLTSSGAAYCWGENGAGQLGDGSSTDRSTPVAVTGGLTFVSLAAGGLFACGLTTSGAAYCWGADNVGQLGDSSTVSTFLKHPTPVAVAGGLTFVSLSAGGDHACGLTTGGIAYCWGDNNQGELGVGFSPPYSNTPVTVSGGLTFASLIAGNSRSCGLTSGGVAYCWGGNDGVLGDSSTTDRSTPVAVKGGLLLTSLALGGAHTCGLTSAGAAYCWGSNIYFQLGDGAESRQAILTPVAVASP